MRWNVIKPLQKKLLLGFVSMLFIAAGAHAQRRQTLKGYIQEGGPGGTPIPYIVSFTLKGSDLQGTSITGQQGPASLEAILSGRMAGDDLLIMEHATADQLSDDATRAYCYFTGRLKKTVKNGRTVYTGPYTSRGNSSFANCQGGFMLLVLNPDDPVKLQQPEKKTEPIVAQPKSPVRSRVEPVATPPEPPKVPQEKPVVIAPPAPKQVTSPPAPIAPTPAALYVPMDSVYERLNLWENDVVKYRIWDGYQGDGDVISVKVDGETVANKQMLQKDGLPIAGSINLADGRVHSLVLLLHEEGKEPPNTPAVQLMDGDNSKTYDVSGKNGQEVYFHFRKK